MTLWHIGNTTVRTPYRLRDALRVLRSSSLNGNLSGRVQENQFAAILHNEGVLHSPRVVAGKDASDLGRKWRSALSQLGFITSMPTKGRSSAIADSALASMTSDIEGKSGRPFEITPNGYRLAESDVVTAQQECMLRSLASYRIPSLIEHSYGCEAFSPLRFVLRVVHGLASEGRDERLTFDEFALFVQTVTPEDGVEDTVDRIHAFRSGRERASGHVKKYDREFYRRAAAETQRQANTLKDYADLSFRYLKATGLFRTKGRGIALSPSRAQLAALLRQEEDAALDDGKYLKSLWHGAMLPTDEEGSSFEVVKDLVGRLRTRGERIQLPGRETSLQELETIRHELEARLLQLDEQEFAESQAGSLDEIMAWLEAIPSRSTARLPDGSTVSVPVGEAPAYLEWAIWRAFLAIDSLCNPPWEARRFEIDQDFLPVSCAPGRGPDMVFEFDGAVVVVEVTLTASSRQEAAEGEPVRRHVAKFAEATDKSVYGLFIAAQIDSNTAHTFRSGDWYLPDDSKIALDIVPLSIADFGTFMEGGRDRLSEMPDLLRRLMVECRAKANQDAPQWKQSISSIVQNLSGHRGA